MANASDNSGSPNEWITLEGTDKYCVVCIDHDKHGEEVYYYELWMPEGFISTHGDYVDYEEVCRDAEITLNWEVSASKGGFKSES